ncbi:MAG: hypothetical protein JWO03_1580 [Bacteroidetes bacterium]|nr:hypothetical protein [Bacteroidota bacterium]
MNLRIIIFGFVLILLVSGCHRLKNKMVSAVRHIGAMRHMRDVPVSTDSFSIKNIVMDFQNDPTIREVRGVQIDNFPFYVEYCVYTGERSRVLSGINKISVKTKDQDLSDTCLPATKEELYKVIVPSEKGMNTDFFWRFEQLKSYDIYTCTKMPFRHYIIFDTHSDTVYHRIEELRE